jgi:hypothetical protein
MHAKNRAVGSQLPCRKIAARHYTPTPAMSMCRSVLTGPPAEVPGEGHSSHVGGAHAHTPPCTRPVPWLLSHGSARRAGPLLSRARAHRPGVLMRARKRSECSGSADRPGACSRRRSLTLPGVETASVDPSPGRLPSISRRARRWRWSNVQRLARRRRRILNRRRT